MAKSTSDNLKPFPPGVSGNPKGRTPVPEDVRRIRALTKDETEKIMRRCLIKTPADLKAMLDNPYTSNLEHIVGAIVQEAIKKKDHARLNFFLERLFGKVPDPSKVQVDITFSRLPSVAEAQQIFLQDPAAIEPPIIDIPPLEDDPAQDPTEPLSEEE